MKSAELKAWVERRKLSHAKAAEMLGITVPALRTCIYRPDRKVGSQTIRIIELLEALERSQRSIAQPNNICPGCGLPVAMSGSFSLVAGTGVSDAGAKLPHWRRRDPFGKSDAMDVWHAGCAPALTSNDSQLGITPWSR